MPLIRTRQDIDDLLGGPTPAEENLLAACLAGEECDLGDIIPPEGTPDPAVHIRADVLRYLITGGCTDHPVADWGVALVGGHITGALDLRFATTRGVTGLIDCRFDESIDALQACFEALNLTRSVLPRLNAQGARVTGSVFLSGITGAAQVRFAGATIGGQLACEGAKFNAPDGHALNAQGARVTGGVFLQGITAAAEVRLSGASIGGQLDCTGAQFNATEGKALNAEGARVTGHVLLRGLTAEAEVRFLGASIGGQLACEGAQFNATKGDALNAQGARVEDGLIWRQVRASAQPVDFNSAFAHVLDDDHASWMKTGALRLHGFTYKRITGFSDIRQRLAWLEKGSIWNGDISPQPYTQLAKVYREMGHDADARAVLFEREKQRRLHRRAQTRIAPNGDIDVAFRSLWRDLKNLVRLVWDLILRLVVGYGVRPFRSLWCLAALTLLATFLAHMAWEDGSIAPNSAVIQTSGDWRMLAENGDVSNPVDVWSDRHGKGRDWETFNRYAYAADLVIPIINLGQTDAWAPSTNRNIWGKRLWQYGFFLTVAGWIVTALGAAAITGIIRSD